MPYRRLVLAYALIAGLAFLLAFAYALRIPPTYTTDALLIAKEQNNSSQLSGLANATKLLGLGGGADQGSNFSKFQKYWASRDVAAHIIEKHPDLLRQMFGGEWDKKNDRWYEGPHSFRQWLAVPLNALFGVYPGYAPTAQTLADSIKSTIKLDLDDQTDEVHVSYSAPDAAFARSFLTTVISETDEAVRSAEQRRDRDFINFARNRLEKETNVGYRDALTDSVRQFEISSMYSEAGDNFSFQYVEMPALPTVHSAPRPLLYTVLAFIIANLVATCLIGAMLLWPASGFARGIGAVTEWIWRRLEWRASRTGGQAPRRTN